MKSDKLEKYIIKNRDKFDVHDPAPELWDKINPEKSKGKIGRLKWRSMIWKVAAMVAIIMSVFLVYELIHFDELKLAWKNKKENKQINIPELREAEIYYSSLIQNSMQKVQSHLTEYPDLRHELIRDFSELDSIYNDLKRDLKDNVANQEVVEALIQNYRIKIKILEDLLYQLQKSNQKKSNKTGKYEI
jgi:hypothetical protein